MGHGSLECELVSALERADGSDKTHEPSAGESWYALVVEHADPHKSCDLAVGAANKVTRNHDMPIECLTERATARLYHHHTMQA